MNHSWTRWLVLSSLLLVAACGTDGGVGGTGISTISGNVTAIGSPDRSEGVEGIAVMVRGTSASGLTDHRGDFELEGMFDGTVTLDFKELDGTVSALPLEVPSSSTLSVRNVRLNRGLATADQIEVTFEGTVVGDPVCDDGGGTVEVIDAESRNTYVLQLDDASFEGDRDCPATPECQDLQPQFRVKIVATQNAGVIRADKVRLVICRQPGRGGR